MEDTGTLPMIIGIAEKKTGNAILIFIFQL